MSAGTGYRPYPPTRWGLVLREGATAPTNQPAIATGSPRRRSHNGCYLVNTTVTVKTHKITTFWRKHRPEWGFCNTAAPIGASIFRAGDMMQLPRIRISKPVTITSSACPQAHFAGVTTTEDPYTPGFHCGRGGS